MPEEQTLVIDHLQKDSTLPVMPNPPLLTSQKSGWSSIHLGHFRQPAWELPKFSCLQHIVIFPIAPYHTVNVEFVLEDRLLTWSDKRQDNFSTATTVGQQSAVDAGYRYVGIDGYVFTTQRPNTVPLNLYWNPAREDNMTTASATGIQAAQSQGYKLVRTEGYVYPASQCQ